VRGRFVVMPRMYYHLKKLTYKVRGHDSSDARYWKFGKDAEFPNGRHSH
jgi:hypothetical protein